MSSAVLIVVSFFFLLLSTNGAPFLKGRFIDRVPAAGAQPAHVVLVLNGNSLSMLPLDSLSPLARLSVRMTLWQI